MQRDGAHGVKVSTEVCGTSGSGSSPGGHPSETRTKISLLVGIF